MSKKIKMAKWCGEEISEYGVENGYVDYSTLAKAVGNLVLNNSIVPNYFEDFELEHGTDYDEENDHYYDIYQYYIISGYGARILTERTDEIVYYNEKLDMYVWGITHLGTSWDYVLTDIKVDEENCYLVYEEEAC